MYFFKNIFIFFLQSPGTGRERVTSIMVNFIKINNDEGI